MTPDPTQPAIPVDPRVPRSVAPVLAPSTPPPPSGVPPQTPPYQERSSQLSPQQIPTRVKLIALATVTVVALLISRNVTMPWSTASADADGAAAALDQTHAEHASDYPDIWDPILAPYVEFVETTRQLKFEHPVEVEFLDVAASLQEQSDSDAQQFDDATLAYYTDLGVVNGILGLTQPGANPWDQAAEVRSAGAAAFYSQDREVIVLPFGGAGDLELSIVHELTHVLQHQNGLLDAPYYDEDASSMRLALTEGDATRIEWLWYEQLSESDRAVLDAAIPAAEDSSVLETDNYFETVFSAPYVLGELTVQMLLATGGHEALDEAISQGYLSTEAMVDPVTDSPGPLDATKRFSPDTAPDGADYGLYGVLGPLSLYLTLAPEIGPGQALDALSGYDIDTYQLWTHGGRSCIDLRIWFDDQTEADAFVGIVGDTLGELSMSQAGQPKAPAVEAVLCDDAPVGDPNNQTMDLLAPVLAQQVVVLNAQQAGSDLDLAVCEALALLNSEGVSFDEDFEFASIILQAQTAGRNSTCTS